MSKRRRRSGSTEAPSLGVRASRQPRDVITRLSGFCEIVALGLVAASFFLNFPNELKLPAGQTLAADYFPTLLENGAVMAVHTRVVWVTLAVLGVLAAVVSYRWRHSPKMGRIAIWVTMAAAVVIGIHAGAQGYLQSLGQLKIETRGMMAAGGGAGGNPTESVTRLTVNEGTGQQWRVLMQGDLLFSSPILLVWLLRFLIFRRGLKGDIKENSGG